MQGDFVSGVVLPAILAFIMFALGLGLRPIDFARVLREPAALALGVLCQFVLLPLTCLAMLKIAGLTGAFAIGFMILAACPTGTTSNLLTYLARGDVALALSFTAVASILTIVTLPFVVAWSLAHFSGASQPIDAPAAQLMQQIFVLLGLPVALGMAMRALRPEMAGRLEPVATKIATVLFILVVAVAIIRNWPLLRDNFTTLAPFALFLNIAMLAIGLGAARLARLSRSQSVTIGIETAIQNATLALVIASSILHNEAMAIPGALYGVLMYAGALPFAYAMRRYIAGPTEGLERS